MSDQPKRTVGAVTGSATAGGGLGAALGAILVHVFPYLEPVTGPIIVVLTVALSLLGGYLVPPKQGESDLEDPFEDVPYDPEPFDEEEGGLTA